MRAIIVCVVVALPQLALGGQASERLDAVIWIKPRGEIEVEETRTLHVRGDAPKTLRYTLQTPYPRIGTFVSAMLDGTYVPLDGDPAAYPRGVRIVRERGRLRLEWTRPAGAGRIIAFSASYLVWNAVDQDEQGDEFRWRLTPLTSDAAIEAATLRLACDVPLARRPEIRGRAGDVRVDGGEKDVVVTARGIPARQHLEIRLRFRRNSAAGTDLRWQTRRDVRQLRAVTILPLTAAALGAGAVWAMRRRRSG